MTVGSAPSSAYLRPGQGGGGGGSYFNNDSEDKMMAFLGPAMQFKGVKLAAETEAMVAREALAAQAEESANMRDFTFDQNRRNRIFSRGQQQRQIDAQLAAQPSQPSTGSSLARTAIGAAATGVVSLI